MQDNKHLQVLLLPPDYGKAIKQFSAENYYWDFFLKHCLLTVITPLVEIIRHRFTAYPHVASRFLWISYKMQTHKSISSKYTTDNPC